MRDALARRRSSAHRRRGPAGLPGERRARPRGSLSLQCAVVRRELSRRSRHVLLHERPGMAGLLPRHGGAHRPSSSMAENQAETGGPFAWRARPASRVRAWASTQTHDFLDAEHDGYARLKSPVRHRRRVLVRQTRRDGSSSTTSYGDGTHRIDLRFQFSPRVVTPGPDCGSPPPDRHGEGLSGSSRSPGADLTVDIRQGATDPAEAGSSPGTEFAFRHPRSYIARGGTPSAAS